MQMTVRRNRRDEHSHRILRGHARADSTPGAPVIAVEYPRAQGHTVIFHGGRPAASVRQSTTLTVGQEVPPLGGSAAGARDMTPCQIANGVDPDRARALVAETFGPRAPATTKYLPS